MINIEREAVNSLGGEEAFTKRVADFQQALVDHSKTVDTPAPTEHAYIDIIVRSYGGKFKIVEPDPVPSPAPLPPPIDLTPPAPEPEPELSFAEAKEQKFHDLSYYKHSQRNAGVIYQDMPFASDNASIAELQAACEMARSDPNYAVAWKTKDRRYPILDADALFGLLQAMRSHAQMQVNTEAKISAKLRSIRSRGDLDAFDIQTEWEAA